MIATDLLVPPSATVLRVACDPVGRDELAARLGFPTNTAKVWGDRNQLPEPDFPTVNGRPAWAWETILEWAAASNRLRSDQAQADYEQLGLPPTDEHVTITEACRRLGVSRQTLYNWIDRGDVVPVRIGSRSFIAVTDVDDLLAGT